MSSTYKPSREIEAVFSSKSLRRLQAEDLHLDSKEKMNKFEELSTGEQVLALHTTFHKVMRQHEDVSELWLVFLFVDVLSYVLLLLHLHYCCGCTTVV